METHELETTRADKIKCPSCSLKIERMTGLGQPEPGGLVICGGCGNLMALDEDLRARRLDEEERQEALACEEVRLTVQLIKGRSRGRATRLN